MRTRIVPLAAELTRTKKELVAVATHPTTSPLPTDGSADRPVISSAGTGMSLLFLNEIVHPLLMTPGLTLPSAVGTQQAAA
ncbi:MAG TPA: hypothetical protein VH417_05155 [Vicinamibacterales bacterium]